MSWPLSIDSSRHAIPLLLLASLALGACSCGEKKSLQQAASVPTEVSFEGEGLFFDALGDHAKATPIVRDQVGELMRNVTFKWGSSDPSVAVVDGSGVVTSKGNGDTVLEIRAGEALARLPVVVRQKAVEVELNPPRIRLYAVGEEARLSAVAVDRNGFPVGDTTFAWSTRDASVAEVNASGTVEARGKGATEAVVRIPESDVSASAQILVDQIPTALRFHFPAPQWIAGAATEVRVEIVDAGGQRVADADGEIRLALGDNPAGGSLSGTLTQLAVDGAATFSDLSIEKAGEGYTLTATSEELEGESDPFDVHVGAPASLRFRTAPTGGIRDEALAVTEVELVDQGGNFVAAAVALSLALEGGPGALHGTLQKSTVQGTASFGDLRIDQAGKGYRLRADAPGLQSALSPAFEIFACKPDRVACDGQCVDVESDASHCGGCGNVCGPDQLCTGRACVCTGGLAACGDACVDTSQDPLHCGGCNSPCPANFTCENSTCVNPCPDGETFCDGSCVDTRRDLQHCGGCNIACNAGDLCAGSRCMPDPEYANWPVPPDRPSAYTQPHNGVVLDGVTRLMWEKSVTNTTYTWQEAKDRCAGLTLAGFDDWRLPTRIELISIVDEGTHYPAINASHFPSTPYKPFRENKFDEGFWSVSPFSGNANGGWQINFSYGFAEKDGVSKSSPGYVRCVRYDASYPTADALPARYTVQADKVKDNRTGLLWRKSTSIGESGSYFQASTWCTGYYFARMPRRKEVETLVDVRRRNPAWDQAFGGPANEWYWASTSHRYGASTFHWAVNFVDGENAATENEWPWGALPRCIH